VPVVALTVAALFLALAVAKPAVAASRYTVMPHDTLYSIASRFHVPLPLLEEVNGIQDPTRLRVGQVLIIPDAAPAVTAARPSAGPTRTTPPHTARHARSEPRKPEPSRDAARREPRHDAAAHTARYVIRTGDTLFHLAATHGTTVQAIEAMNGLASSTIRAGQIIRLPEARTPPRTPVTAHTAPAARPVPPAATAAARVPDSPRLDSTGREPAAPVLTPGTDQPVRPSEVRAPDEPSHASTAATTRVALLRHVRETALNYVGVPYRWGGTTPAGVDCSGLVYAVYSPYVANLPRTSYNQWTAGVAVDRADLAAGDLVFFDTDGSGASHVGIYIGDGQFVHSATTPRRVVVDRLDNPYYVTHYIGARRVL
jgi:peptidoglycan DL-endopeptidase LytE